MNPILLSTTIFLILETAHYFNPAFAFGLAVGGGLMCLFSLIEVHPSQPPSPQEESRGEG